MDNITKSKTKWKTLSVKVGNHLFKKLINHINELAFLKQSQISKQEWFEKAIKEKLDMEQHLCHDKEFLKQKLIFPKISKDLDKCIEAHIDAFKKSRVSYSKKQWVVDAIYEKLDRDEHAIREMLREKFKEMVGVHSTTNSQSVG